LQIKKAGWKTTTAVNLSAYLAEMGEKIALVDFDPQSNSSSSLGFNGKSPGIYEAIMGKTSVGSVLYKTEIENLYIVPSNINLAGATVELVNQKEREFFLKSVIERIDNSFDYIFIDCPPSLGLLTLNGLVAANYVIIPLQCEYFALEGLTLLMDTVKRVQENLNPDLMIGGIVFTMYDIRTKIAHEVVQEVVKLFKDLVFHTIIPRNVRLSEAPSFAKPISIYDPECSGAKSYKKLAEEVIRNV